MVETDVKKMSTETELQIAISAKESMTLQEKTGGNRVMRRRRQHLRKPN